MERRYIGLIIVLITIFVEPVFFGSSIAQSVNENEIVKIWDAPKESLNEGQKTKGILNETINIIVYSINLTAGYYYLSIAVEADSNSTLNIVIISISNRTIRYERLSLEKGYYKEEDLYFSLDSDESIFIAVSGYEDYLVFVTKYGDPVKPLPFMEYLIVFYIVLIVILFLFAAMKTLLISYFVYKNMIKKKTNSDKIHPSVENQNSNPSIIQGSSLDRGRSLQ